MKKFTTKTLRTGLGAFAPLSSSLPALLTNRLVVCSQMDGAPVANYIIGTLQRVIQLNSFPALLESLRRMRDLAYVASEVVLSVEGIRADKYAIIKDEVTRYVDEVIGLTKHTSVLSSDKDFIARLIIAFEANPTAWTLYSADAEKNLHVQMSKLYTFVLSDSTPATMPVYRHDNSIAVLASSPRFAKAKKPPANSSPEQIAAWENNYQVLLNDSLTIHRLAAVKMLDHVYSLLMEKDLWYAWVSPRYDAKGTASNIERGKTLQSLALYMQGLLSYTSHFQFEGFLYMHDITKLWLQETPSLGTKTTERIALIRKHDYLGAEADVREYMSSFSASGSSPTAANFTIVPSELGDQFGLRKSMEDIKALKNTYTYRDALSQLSDLDQARYLPLISSVTVKEMDIHRTVAKLVLQGALVESEVNAVMDVLLDSIGRNTAEDTIARLKALNLRSPLYFKGLIPGYTEVTTSLVKEVKSGVLKLDGAAPDYSLAFNQYVKKNLIMKVFTSDSVTQYENFNLRQIINQDKRAKLADLFDCTFSSLLPSQYGSSSLRYKTSELATESNALENVIEALTGSRFELAVIQLRVKRLRKLWATVFSSFAIMYVNDSLINRDIFSPSDTDDSTVDLLKPVEGWGMPYGTSYTNLASKQSPLKDLNQLVKLLPGVYMKIHNTLPVVGSTLAKLNNYYSNESDVYFQANGATEAVEEWVVTPGFWNFTLFPNKSTTEVPVILFSDKFAYLNSDVFIHTDRSFEAPSTFKARQSSNVAVNQRNWPWDLAQPGLKYIVFGQYSSFESASIQDEIPESEMTKIQEKIDAKIKEDLKEEAASEQTVTNTLKSAERIATEDLNMNNPSLGHPEDLKKKAGKEDVPDGAL